MALALQTDALQTQRVRERTWTDAFQPGPLPRIFAGGAAQEFCRGSYAKQQLIAQRKGCSTPRSTPRQGMAPPFTPRSPLDGQALPWPFERSNHHAGLAAVVGDGFGANSGRAGAVSGWWSTRARSVRNYPNPTRSVLEVVSFNQDVDCSREALFGEAFSGAAGKPLICSQAPYPRSARRREAGPPEPTAPERQHGGLPAGVSTAAAVIQRRRAWEQ
mmetsp:Transcript_10446/g.29047  ORF Transcript_10446/g.29047 Transcript_10446/m.29047 type:complete len:217 (-) Transcript_10446:76-726(-)